MRYLSTLRYIGRIFFFPAIFVLIAFSPVQAKEPSLPPKVLLLHSFPLASHWEVKTRESFRSTLAASRTVEIYEEYLDLTLPTVVDYRGMLLDLLRVKYSQIDFDLVVAMSDPASDYLLQHGQELFPGIPKILNSGGWNELKEPPRNRKMTSVYFEYDVLASLRFALKLFPETTDVLIVTGSGNFTKFLLYIVRKQLAKLGASPKLTYLPILSIEEICDKVSRLPSNYLVFYIGIAKDSTGRRFRPSEACKIISDAANAPVFGISDTYLGSGIIGGKLVSSEMNGRTLGKVALRILGGEKPEAIAPTRALDKTVFDWRQLKRWGLLGHPLTAGAEIKYREITFLGQYWHWFLIGVGLLILQSLVIVLLLVQRKLKREKEQERLKAEQSLRESEQRYREMFHSDRVVQLLIDPEDGSINDANQAACDFYGYGFDELTNKNITDINTASPEWIYKAMGEAESGNNLSFRGKHQLASREIRDVEVYSSPLTQEGRTFLHSTIFDITKRKQAEKALRISEEKFSKIFFDSPVAVCITTINEGRLLEGNHAFFEQSGHNREKSIGKTTEELDFWSDPVGDRERVLERYRKEGSIRNMEANTRLKNQDSTILWSLDPIIYDDQKCFLNVFIDITERKKAQEALLQSEAQFRILVENAPVGVVIQTRNRAAYVNKKAAEAFGAKDREELLGTPVLNRVPERFHDLVLKRIKLAIVEKQSTPPLEYQFLRIDGSEFDVEVMAVPFNYQNEDGTLIFFQDISRKKKEAADKKTLEAQLGQAQKMQAIGTLAGGIAHDFNNILGVVIGFTEMALLKSQNRREITPELSRILEAGERARDLVRQIMTFSRKVEVELKPLSLNDELKNIVDLLQRTLPKMIDIETDFAADLTPIEANANQLEQIILNLANNAQHAMPEGGNLAFKTRNITLTADYCARHLEVKPGRYVLLEVSDTGMGMDEQTKEQIFDPFFTTKDVGEGTGLGLSTVYGIVKAFRGQIICYSEPGVGTTFKIYLPAFDTQISTTDVVSSSKSELATGNETILLVDDDDALRELGRQILTMVGYKTITARSGEEALDLYTKQKDALDLVILDLGMPGMGGYKALEEILKFNPRAKVVIASGYAATDAVNKALQGGAAGYITKPFSSAELLSTVRKLLDLD
ncbi:chemotaxis protein CheY [Dethiosulfatarculus sandiegensis]|uniref:histidine kinase n=1 Tax=Dethiosulfatarculus sandiegensis TaxID=1429043 RepID=A0A0D2JW15_9BACT|nr:chemotaxis protein CheY [Dethiosulfatarculus sandiegensis]